MAFLKSDDLADLAGKTVLITGGTGSFGRMMLQTLLRKTDVRKIILYARGEYNHFEIQSGLGEGDRARVRNFIGDIRDKDRLKMALRGVDIVIHAAAQKQVPLAEYNPFECIRTNVVGAENVVNASIEAGVKTVLALSTDKAVNPINLYGASKLASDKIFVAANALAGYGGTRFSVVRYGNVLGSRGSVIPFFKKIIDEGAAELPITDDRMTRFWITLEDAVEFTLSSLTIMRGGEIFVPKIPSMLITDLANAMAPDLPQNIVGIRPGEKLHELMITDHNSLHTVDYGDRYIIDPEWRFWDRNSYHADGYPLVEEGFEYRSDNNNDWLTVDALKDVITQLGMMPAK